MSKIWRWKQQFSFRASTLLILFIPILVGLDYLTTWVPFTVRNFVKPIIAASGDSAPLLMLISSIFAAGYLIVSLYRRQPQIQFLGEIFIAIAVRLSIHAY